MFLIRQAGPQDFHGVFALAKILDSYNLPGDRSYIRQLLTTSQSSFAGKVSKEKAKYLFVLEDVKPTSGPFGKRTLQRKGDPEGGPQGRIVGCSLIIAQHGTPGHPHLWLALKRLTRYSRSLRLRRSHTVLKLGSTEDGPTEVGGLVVAPAYRGNPARCGMQISFVRFLYMAMHPSRFEEKVLVEFRGAMGKGNRSIFWEAMGRLFTGLAYPKADRLSVFNKEFILSLFPSEPIYCALLPTSIQEAIGAIHPAAKKAASLLSSIGFRPIPQVEPFDGGPYYAALRRQIRIVRRTRPLILAEAQEGFTGAKERASWSSEGASGSQGWYLVGTEGGWPGLRRGLFRAAMLRARVQGNRCYLKREDHHLLKASPGERVYACEVVGELSGR